MTAPRQITIRNPPPELSRRLKALAEQRGQSVNRTVLELLSEALGLDERRARLMQYVTWTEEDRREFEAGLAAQREVEDDLWG